MINMTDCMLRNLQRFVEFDLNGLIRWDQVQTIVPESGGGNVAEIEFMLDGREYIIRVESSEFNPSNPCGCVRMNGKPQGPIDEMTWTKMAREIKKQIAATV